MPRTCGRCGAPVADGGDRCMTCGLKVGAAPRPATLRAFGPPAGRSHEQPVPEPGSAAAVAIVPPARGEPADATGTRAVAEVVPIPRSRPGSTAPGVWKPGPPADVWT